MTTDEAIQAAEKEFQISRYHEELSPYPGIRAMHSRRASWLSILLALAKQAIAQGKKP